MFICSDRASYISLQMVRSLIFQLLQYKKQPFRKNQTRVKNIVFSCVFYKRLNSDEIYGEYIFNRVQIENLGTFKY